jgi:hypothetical protein
VSRSFHPQRHSHTPRPQESIIATQPLTPSLSRTNEDMRLEPLYISCLTIHISIVRRGRIEVPGGQKNVFFQSVFNCCSLTPDESESGPEQLLGLLRTSSSRSFLRVLPSRLLPSAICHLPSAFCRLPSCMSRQLHTASAIFTLPSTAGLTNEKAFYIHTCVARSFLVWSIHYELVLQCLHDLTFLPTNRLWIHSMGPRLDFSLFLCISLLYFAVSHIQVPTKMSSFTSVPLLPPNAILGPRLRVFRSLFL